MSIVDKDGKPIQKNWEQMDNDERMSVLRQGLGILMKAGEEQFKTLVAIDRKLMTVLKSIDQYEESLDGKESGDSGDVEDGIVSPEGTPGSPE